MTVAEASQLLKASMGELIRLEILPAVQLRGINTDTELTRRGQDFSKTGIVDTLLCINYMQKLKSVVSYSEGIGGAIWCTDSCK